MLLLQLEVSPFRAGRGSGQRWISWDRYHHYLIVSECELHHI